MSASPRILLFDIDGTLVLTQGAGALAMNRALQQMFALPAERPPLGGIAFAGRSDAWILQTVLDRLAVPYSEKTLRAFQETYAAALPHALTERDGRVLPGIEALLEALAGRAVVGLGTGNFRLTGMAKLDHFGIGKHFVDGGFGDDSPDRPALLAAGLERLRAHAGTNGAAAEAIVIGDTVHDVTAGHAIGARVVAVTTGFGRYEDLVAAGADVILPDCSDLAAVLAALLD